MKCGIERVLEDAFFDLRLKFVVAIKFDQYLIMNYSFVRKMKNSLKTKEKKNF